MEKYLEGLNAEQLRASTHLEGPLMIVAGAGSGKTKVLTTRVAHLINNGVDAFNILALTFTNKAAAEMKERVEHILGNSEARNLYIGTFHSIFARILRKEAPLLGYPSNFTIYDTDDAKSVIKGIVNAMQLDDKHYKPSYIYSRISAAKNGLINPAEYKLDRQIQQEDAQSKRPMMGDIYDAYVRQCFKNGAMDFDDLLLKMYLLLTTVPEVLSRYQRRFKYILIDVYQDTNTAQYNIIKLLGAMHENICVVGDDAQSIYSFRGATVQNILQFKDDYDDVTIVKLEQNYRSTLTILNVANNIIGNNKNQIPKELWTSNMEGEKIVLARTATDNDEGRFVADAIKEQQMRNHYANRDFSVLYRTNAQSRAFEESLRRMNIPYKLVGGTSFYQRKEVKDLLGYLRVIVNQQDEENLKRIINYPARGIGKTTQERMQIRAAESGNTFWQVAESGGWGSKVEEFTIMIKSFKILLEQKNAYDIAFLVGKHTGLIQELYNDKTVEGLARYENVQELLNSIKEFTETPDEEGELQDKTLGSYLQQITLLTDADTDANGDADAVRLMTVHAAKGLEFKCVFIVGMEENLFPSAMAMYDREGLEEERRLFYVAVTRAKERLWITFANSRYRFGSLIQNDPSRFLDEIPVDKLDRSHTGPGVRPGGGFNPGGSQGDIFSKPGALKKLPGKTGPTPSGRPAQAPTPRPTGSNTPSGSGSSDGFSMGIASEIAVGMKVEHQKFGIGKVLSLEGGISNRMASIDFGEGAKKIMLNYAKLRIVG